ncbi:hypothetical protein P262_04940 [Cronobacter malonaticus]|uniref:Uncharacterized protein n=1 Tax=Cronobacter malonaticus TaxID=413503 RepID=V5U4G0_9ENTR|nr:hypothetical protein P262_04940 [Cronobacter malonaticus]
MKEKGAAAPFFIGREKAKETAGALRLPALRTERLCFVGWVSEAHPPVAQGFVVL